MQIVDTYTLMKNKSSIITTSEELLRKIIREELKDYATKSDLETLKLRINDQSRQYRDDILTKLDKDTAENEQLKEDNDFNKYDIRDLKQTSDNHEKRIAKLEQP